MMEYLEKVYDFAPIFFQNIMVSAAGYLHNVQRYGLVYHQQRKFLEDFDKWNLEKKLEFQRTELLSFLRYSFVHSKFYRELYKNVDFDSFHSVEDLKRLPIIEKDCLRRNIHDVTTIGRKGSVEGHTGGTTGMSLVVLFTVEDTMKRHAMLDHFKSRVGFENRKMKRATFNGKHIVPPKQEKKVFWRYNSACKQMIFSSFHLTENNLKYYVDELNKFKPQAIDGFFMSICDVASYIERHNISLNFCPIAIFPTSETLTKSGRALIEKVFKCKVYDQYASSEGAPFITDCKDQTLHIELASGIIEQLSDDCNEILVTSFTTHGTPLIRYRIGDSVKLDHSNSKCNCGIESINVEEIQGRSLDFLYTSEGAKINGGNIANLFKNMPNAIIRAQVIQEKIDEITVLIEVDEKVYKPEFDEMLKKEFLHKFGAHTTIRIEHVQEISREKSGKFKLIKNNVERL